MNTTFILMGGVAVAIAGIGAAALLLLPGGSPPETTQQVAPVPVARSAPAAPPPRAAPPKRQDFADWVLLCRGSGAEPSCLIAQNHLRPDTEQTVFAIQMRRSADDGVEAALITPLYVRLRQGLALDIGGAEPIRAAFDRCMGQQCQATVVLDNEALAGLLAAPKPRASFEMAGGRTFAIDLSLDGLAEALAALGLQPGRGHLLRRSQ